ncbi:hypothetical protein HX109_03020 [Galbibacter sp. BG1]|uniref:DUF2231 domain-containing protein n=1 Tax=Galbibacter sp. BG1 TaxID=1170699 RepID=UPI0015C01314|nr:DUF2231 domain-containing protein [Galbibacter sp. BG1]QLE00582.1 hypothetical protein HX109_03020 [Galbibacter sp. BG1]
MVLLDSSIFFGRLHPLVVHLPIGFVILAILLEWIGYFRKTKNYNIIALAWLLAAISCVLTALFGWLLADTGLYVEEQLFWHRWLGILLIFIFILGYYLKRNADRFNGSVQSIFNILVLFLIAIEGHHGGNLTHGQNYLTEYAPGFVKKITEEKGKNITKLTAQSPDSIVVYAQLIHPILDRKCVSCHNDEVTRGGLNMAHIDSLKKGGSSGSTIVVGKPEKSELFKRITMSPTNIKYMPPTKEILTFYEIKLLEWWILQGASYNDTLKNFEVKDDIQKILWSNYNINTKPSPWYTKVKLPALDSLELQKIQQNNFLVRQLGEQNSLLDVTFIGKVFTDEALQAINEFSEYVTWFSLSNTEIKTSNLEALANFKNLTRLELDHTSIGCEELSFVEKLNHLEALNLFNTNVEDNCLHYFENLPELKKLYMGNTQVTSEGVARLKAKNKDITIPEILN